MAATPLLYKLADWITTPTAREPGDEDLPREEYAPVIIAGFGRVGQIIARALNAKDIHFVALESRFEQLDFVRKYGNKVYYADARNIDTLRSAGINRARVLVLALQDVEASLKITHLVRTNFPHVRIVARARNREHAHQLLHAGAHEVIRDTFHSSLRMAEEVMKASGMPNREAKHAVRTFGNLDRKLLRTQTEFHEDHQQIADTLHAAELELRQLFQDDHPDENK